MNDFEIINVADVTEKTNDSNDRMSVKFDALETSEKVFVPENKKLDIIKKIHDQPTAEHSEERRTLQMIQRFFEWPKMRADVRRYVRNCHVCRRSKAPKNGYHGELQPIESENRLWQNISLNFVTGLSESKGFNAILMIVDRFSKMHHYIACTAEKERTKIDETMKMLIDHVWKLHELSKTIIFDRDPQFVSLIWTALCKILSIKTKLSTAFHSEIDEQSEKFNQKMKRYFRVYINYQQNDWSSWLSMIKYASNASTSTSSTMSPFSWIMNMNQE